MFTLEGHPHSITELRFLKWWESVRIFRTQSRPIRTPTRHRKVGECPPRVLSERGICLIANACAHMQAPPQPPGTALTAGQTQVAIPHVAATNS